MTPDTQATLLLVGRFDKLSETKPLTTVEYNRLAKQLHQLELRPADIVRGIPQELVVDTARLTALLSRGTSLALAIERWARLGITVIGRGDEAYPNLLKRKLRGAASPILYLAGNAELLNAESVCVVGSRAVSDAGLEFATQLGKRCAAEGFAVISGDARGVDRAAMDGALDQGGNVVAVLVDALIKAVLSKRNREAILAGKLALLAPFDPESGFTIPKAMDRNKYLYALASAAVVVDSDIKGGTWSGAIENNKHQWTPAFVRINPGAPAGNQRLAELGLRPIVTQDLSTSLRDFLSSKKYDDIRQGDLLQEQPELLAAAPIDPPAQVSSSLYTYFIEELTAWLKHGPQSDIAIAVQLELEKSQVKRWLERALEDEVIQKLNKPVRYGLRREGVGSSNKSSKPITGLLI